MRRDAIVNKLLWILTPVAVLGLVAAVQSAGCANTASDCAALGLPSGCGVGGAGGATTVASATGTGGSGGKVGTGGTTSSSSASSTGAGGTGAGGSAAGAVCKARRGGDGVDQSARGAMADAAGHLLIGGDFQGTLDFGLSPTLSATAGPWSFVALFDEPTLKPIWNRAVQATYLASALDPSGNVIVAGTYASGVSLDFGCGALDSTKSFFLAKIDPTHQLPGGKCLFSKAFTAPLVRASLATDASGAIVLAGTTQAPTNSPIELGMGSLQCAGGLDIVAAKFDPTGVSLWSRGIGTAANEEAVSLALDSDGNAYVTGDFDGKLDFATGSNGLTTAGMRDIFVARFDAATGTSPWQLSFKGPNDDRATGLAVVPGGLVVGGDFTGSLDVGTKHLTSASAFVVARLKLDGSVVGASALDGKGNGTFSALTATASAGFVLTGSDAATGGLLVAAFDGKGVPLFDTTFPGTGASRGLAVVTHGGAIDVAGTFDGTMDLGGANMLQSSGMKDVFVAHICP